ncbi:MAG: MotA/TolQ/ExbB proton channel family protein [Candidatus Brocadiaceae bacterium]|nr:MotA/TolQ/ExbB proton channel family protein [Candidatus Brocadiaceae bacterium]
MEWLISAGPLMLTLLVCSVLSLAVIIEKAISLRRNKVLKPEIIHTIELIKSTEDIPFAISRCEVISGPFSNLVRRILVNIHLPREEKLFEIEAAGRQETRELEKRLWILELIYVVAPLLGLLGTVLGLENIFGVISELGLGHAKAFSGGLAVAIRNTAVGLFVAIPSIIAYSYFDKKVDAFALEMEEYTLHIMNKLYSSEGTGKK